MDIFVKSNDKIPEKYYEVREQFQNGDIVLYKGSSFLAKSIQYFDKAYFNHIGIIWKVNNRLFTLDMWKEGLVLTPLSNRMKGYKDFCVLRPKKVSLKKIDVAIDLSLDSWTGNVKYDFFLLFRIALIKKTGIDITGLGKKKKFICSEFAQEFCNYLGIPTYKNIKLITPQDFMRFIDSKEFDILFDDSKNKK